jgi:hypothetical protein
MIFTPPCLLLVKPMPPLTLLSLCSRMRLGGVREYACAQASLMSRMHVRVRNRLHFFFRLSIALCSALLVDPSMRPPNLDVVTGAQAVRVLWEQPQPQPQQPQQPQQQQQQLLRGASSGSCSELVAAGVEVLLADGSRALARASELSGAGGAGRGDVILAAGALGVPALLQRSGVGPKAVLQVRRRRCPH